VKFPVVLALVACLAGPARAIAAEVVRVGGTGSAVAAMERIGDVLHEAAPDTGLRVLPSLGSTGAVRAIADGAIDVAVVGRPLSADERGRGVHEREVARTLFVFAVGPGTRASGLDTEQLVAIYRGTRTTWPDGQRVRPVMRPASDADSDLVRAISPEVAAAVAEARNRPGMLLAITNTECNQLLERTPGAIGPTSLLQIRAEGRPLRALAWNGVEPTLANLEAGRYPLGKSIWIVFRENPSPGVRRLLSFLASPRGRDLLRSLGALPVDAPPVE
jgi:phosphate transport system substrate-binding protein